jgi:PIN domain nuclease of toxin-antitoxin system
MSVFDTSAVLAIMYGEKGGDAARKHLDGGSLSRVNFGEVLADLVRSGYGAPGECAHLLSKLGLRLRSVYENHAERVAELKQIRGLSLGDCFCIALGEATGETLITADRQWADLELSVPVELIR